MIKYIGVLMVSLLALSGCKNNYGVTHAAATGGVVCATGYALRGINVEPEVVKTVQVAVTVLATGHFYSREREARGGIPFSEWDEAYGSSDSQWDAVAPAIGGMVGAAAC